jgi:hypothetical protein
MHWILLLFLVKLAAGAVYGYLFTKLPNYAQNADTWRLFIVGIAEKDWLMQDPGAWLADIYTPRYEQDAGMLATQNSLLNDLKDVLVVKFISLCNILSGNRYYVNLIFFNSLFLYGQVALAVIWSKLLKLPHAGVMLVAVCLWPSVLFWSSGFHRDGMLLHFLGGASWFIWNMWQAQKVKPLQILGLLICLLFIFLFRNYVALFFVGAAMVAFVVNRYVQASKKIMLASVGLAVCFLIIISSLKESYSLPAILVERQSSFLQLEGQSKLAPLPLDNSWWTMVKLLPKAVVRATLVPPVLAPFKLSDLPFALENVFWVISIFPAIFFIRKKRFAAHEIAWICCCFLLCLSTLLITGYTIPFATAIVRYKSLLWPFMAPLVVYFWYSKGKQWMPFLRSNT